ncbi:FAD-binding oxidoreductase [Cellulosimicrobium sp. Marseille-Q4280]|uniref:FAD-binding oxidoreductase n=1 Tax=Cellulosimicrobium sp. Marseille-Q4280 TaxID=2937992 RepID=UPI00203E8074|nr:FAD-binding oxidoreductase [Cellulosimicrobium sp. Marseille-Q4280]
MTAPPTVVPSDAGYEAARRGLAVSGVAPADRPALVVRARGVDDVVAALGRARARGTGVTVRSGGHGTAFTALRDGALALDVSRLDGVVLDAASGTADVGPGATSLALADALDGTGFAFPVGHKAGVGLGGFLLAGGNGWNQGEWGSACESVVGAQVVLADGRVVEVDAQHDPEAFAVLRGAGPAFPGVVTCFRLRLWPEPVVRRRTVHLRPRGAGDHGRAGLTDVGAWADALARVVAPQVELTLVLVPVAGGTPAVVANLTAFGRDAAHADTLLAPLDGPLPAAATAVVRSATSIAGLLRADTVPERPVGQVGPVGPVRPGCVAQQAWTTAGYAEVLPRLATGLGQALSGTSSVLVSSASYRRSALPGPPAPSPPLHRPLGTLTVAAYAVWEPGVDDEANLAWPSRALAPLADLTTGHYVGETDLRRTPERLARCWTDGGVQRVRALRGRLDPHGLFVPPPGLDAVAEPSTAPAPYPVDLFPADHVQDGVLHP